MSVLAGQESEYNLWNESIHILVAALFCHIYETMCDFCFFFDNIACLYFGSLGVQRVNTQCPHSDYFYVEEMFALVPNVSMQ